MLRADAPIFEPPSGYGLLDYEKDTKNPEWASDDSTAVPSPWISPLAMMADSPWSSFVSSENLWTGFQDANFALPDSYAMGAWLDFETPLKESFDDANFALPDVHDTLAGLDAETAPKGVHLHPPAVHENVLPESNQADFKLDGLGNLQESLTNLLNGLLPQAGASPSSTTDGASTTSRCNSINSAPVTPPNFEPEFPLPSGIEKHLETSAPPGLEDYVPLPIGNTQIMSPTCEANISLPPGIESAALASPNIQTQVALPESINESSTLVPAALPNIDTNASPHLVDKGLEVPDTIATPSQETAVKPATTKPDLPPLPARMKHMPMQPTNSPMTTVLLQNIPNKCTREMLEKRLDDENFLCHIDFIYVPKNLKNKCNVGYAVLNFRNEKICADFTKRFHNMSTKDAFPGFSGKGLCTVSAAQLQGKEANMSKLQKSSLLMSMLASTPEWLPRLFDDEGKPVELTEPVE